MSFNPVYPTSVLIEAAMKPWPVPAWQDVQNLITGQGWVKKVGPWDGWNSGARSVAELTSGDGYVEFISGDYAWVGFNHDDPIDPDDIYSTDFSLYCYPPGYELLSWEGASPVSPTNWDYGDRLRVSIEYPDVVYYQNGVEVRRVSSPTITYPLYVHTLANEVGQHNSNIVIDFPNYTEWENLTNIVPRVDRALEKISGSSAWDAQATTKDTLAVGTDGFIRFKASAGAFVGLNRDASPSVSPANMDFGFFCSWTGNQLFVYENGVTGVVGNWNDDDILKIQVQGSNMIYSKNDVPLKTSTIYASDPFYGHVLMYLVGDKVEGLYASFIDYPEPTWTPLLDVQQATPVTIQRGNDGTSQRDRVAQTGSMSFELNNAENNDAELLGYYSPRNVNHPAGWKEGIEVRCRVLYDASYYTLFRGSIDAIVPQSGMYKGRKVRVSCVDWMNEAAKARVKGLGIQIDKTSSEVFAALLTNIERQPADVDNDSGIDTYPFALDNALVAEVSVMSEFQSLALSEMGRVYVAADGTLVFEGRHVRPNASLALTLTDEDIESLGTSTGLEAIINYSEVSAHPRRVDAANAVLFSLNGSPKLAAGAPYTVTGLFRDPNSRASRVGGMSMVTPEAGTDFVFNTQADGTGDDITDQLEGNVVATFFSNSVEFVITNPGPSDGYLTTLQCRGIGIYSYEPVVAKGQSQDSKDLYGESGFTLDMPYQDDIRIAKDAADFVVQQSKALYTPIRAVTFVGNREDQLMLAALQREISDKVKVEETVIGTETFVPPGETEPITPTSFFINAVRLTIQEHGIITCRWALEPADHFSYWILGSAGYTELGETTRLAFGAFIP